MSGAPGKANTTALILAAGGGERLGGTAKAFLVHRGMTLLEHAAVLALDHCARVLIGVAAVDRVRAEAVVSGRAAEILEGGASRQDTVGILLARADTEWLLVHEAARPFASPALFARLFAGAAGQKAVVPMTAVNPSTEKSRDKIMYEKRGFLAESGNTAALQTPQLYRRDALEAAYREANRQGWQETSTATLVYRCGVAVKLIAGETGNVKLTYPEDLALLEN